MSGDHYFSQTPSSELKPKRIHAYLAGRELELETAAGTFSPDHVDGGTAVLLKHLDQAPAAGNLLDIGCGWGPIAIALALANPETTVWAVDVNDRSLELARRNVATAGLTNVKICRPDEVPADLEFTGIWSNPPIRVGKAVLHEILQTWLPRLAEECEAYLVVAKDLGADSLLAWLQNELPELHSERADTDKGFRILRVTRL
ncbi:MAG: class I SAM-dependent methyltransferase [Micrococcales bacterium]